MYSTKKLGDRSQSGSTAVRHMPCRLQTQDGLMLNLSCPILSLNPGVICDSTARIIP